MQIDKMAKKTFEIRKRVPNVIFPRFRGGIWPIKMVSEFGFGVHFWYPQNRIFCASKKQENKLALRFNFTKEYTCLE